MWIWRVREGRMYQTMPDGSEQARWSGYSGAPGAINDPAKQDRHSLGPIPIGVYVIGKERETTENHGPVVLPLSAMAGSETFGRNGFLVHGDSIQSPGQASHGCIILARAAREEMASSTDRLLVVLGGTPPEAPYA